LVFAIEPQIGAPLISGLALVDRVNLYNQLVIVGAAAFGFTLTAVTILVSLDSSRKIVKELTTGEGFRVLVANMLSTVFLLILLTILGIAGGSLDASPKPSLVFERFVEMAGLAAVAALAISGFYFAVSMYKVAAHE
jgi:hypothetical protein